MIQRLVNSISQAIYNEYGDDYQIFENSMEQGIEEPCFFIKVIRPSSDLFRGRMYERKNLVSIQYFPEAMEKEVEIRKITETMFDILELIAFVNEEDKEEWVRGNNMYSDIVDGILNFYVEYDFFTYTNQELDPMTDFTSDVTARSGE